MVLGLNGRGRPYFVADIPFDNHKRLRLLDQFYKATAQFRYRDIMALSRAFSVHPGTVENWKYRLTFPRWDIALDVIDWVKRGKPMDLVYHRKKPSDMF